MCQESSGGQCLDYQCLFTCTCRSAQSFAISECLAVESELSYRNQALLLIA